MKKFIQFIAITFCMGCTVPENEFNLNNIHEDSEFSFESIEREFTEIQYEQEIQELTDNQERMQEQIDQMQQEISWR